jgi:hypothetical protein
MEKDTEKNVMKVIENNKKEMEEHTGISSSMTDTNMVFYFVIKIIDICYI